MTSYARPRPLSGRPSLRLMGVPLSLAIASALVGCSETVVTEAVAVKPVPHALMRRLPAPSCDIPDEAEIAPQRVAQAHYCLSQAELTARNRLHGLQDAVRKREQVVATAVSAGKK